MGSVQMSKAKWHLSPFFSVTSIALLRNMVFFHFPQCRSGFVRYWACLKSFESPAKHWQLNFPEFVPRAGSGMCSAERVCCNSPNSKTPFPLSCTFAMAFVLCLLFQRCFLFTELFETSLSLVGTRMVLWCLLITLRTWVGERDKP